MLERAEINPNLLLDQLSNIVALTKQYGFNDIFIASPSPIDNTNILFIISRQSENRSYIKFCVGLLKLLDVDVECLITTIREDLKPEFDEYYKNNMISLFAASLDDVKLFLKNKLSMELNVEQTSNSQAASSQIGKFFNNNKESVFEEKESTKFFPKRTNGNQSQD